MIKRQREILNNEILIDEKKKIRIQSCNNYKNQNPYEFNEVFSF